MVPRPDGQGYYLPALRACGTRWQPCRRILGARCARPQPPAARLGSRLLMTCARGQTLCGFLKMVGRGLKLVDEGLEVCGFCRFLSLELWSHSSQFRAAKNCFLFCGGSIDFATEPDYLIDIIGCNHSS